MDVMHDYLGTKYTELQGVYPVSEDSMMLLKTVERFLGSGPGRLLDMGCGVGLITLKSVSAGWDVVAVDREPKALEGLRRNLSLNGVNARLVLSHLFSGVPRAYLGHFDLITFNPPYLGGLRGPISRRDDLPLYGGTGGYELAVEFLEKAGDFISDNGSILLLGYGSWPVKKWVRRSHNPLKVNKLMDIDLDGEMMAIYHLRRNEGWIGESLYSSEDNSTEGEI
ncbi:MAG: methyltransferase [Thermoplasmatota archaeon]